MVWKVDVVKESEGTFVVSVENGTKTSHKVSLNFDDYHRLTEGCCSEEELIKESFYFLLEREDNDMILKSFDLMEISRYFPEYVEEIKKRIS